MFSPSRLEEANSPHLSSEEKFWPITRSQLETANVGMRWQNLFLELRATYLSVRRAAPESLLSGSLWQLLPAGGWRFQRLLVAWVSASRIPHVQSPGPEQNAMWGFFQNFHFGKLGRGESSERGHGMQ